MSASLSIADALFGKTQQAVLALLFGQPERYFYTREIVSAAGLGASQVQKELEKLTRAGLVTREPRGNQVWLRANSASPVFKELKTLVSKTFGIADVVRAALEPFSRKIVAAFIYGSVARGEHDAASDVDVFIVGDVAPSKLASARLQASQKLGRNVSLVVYGAMEMAEHVASREHFVTRLAGQPKISLFGSDAELQAVYGQRTAKSRQRKTAKG